MQRLARLSNILYTTVRAGYKINDICTFTVKVTFWKNELFASYITDKYRTATQHFTTEASIIWIVSTFFDRYGIIIEPSINIDPFFVLRIK